MNTQQIQGSWNQLRGQIKERWGALTDEDLQLHGGNVEQVVGRIQQRTGESREAIEEFLGKLSSQGSAGIAQAAEAAGQYARQASQQLRDRYQDVASNMSEGYENVERMVRDRPTQSVAAALGVGLVVGVMVGLALKSR
jgi:uncharacterized protein YjbJ (UPF0337 family)